MSTQASLQVRELSPAKAQAQARVQSAGRLLYVDNLRVFLTILVVLHHLAITYGGSGGWAYVERPTSELAGIALTMFNALNQGYFMGLFFLIAGYFVPGSVDRKGSLRFLKDRLMRLGIPLALYALLISPLMVYINGITEGWWSGTLREFLGGYWSRIGFDSGPLWFVEVLLVFSAVYACGRAALSWLKRGRPEQVPAQKPLTHKRLLAAIPVLILANVAVRLVSPIGETWHNWQLAYFPQYILLFAAGILAYRQNWLAELPAGVRATWSKVAIGGLVSLPILLFGMVMLNPAEMESNFAKVMGGLNPLAITTAVWEAIYCLSMPVLLFSIFRSRFDGQGRLGQLLSQNAFTVYIIHAPVIVFTALAFRSVDLEPLLKFVLLAPLCVGLCFLASMLVRRLPLADRVL